MERSGPLSTPKRLPSVQRHPRSAYNFFLLITVFSNTLPAAKRKEIEDAVVAAGRRLSRPFEAFLVADQVRAGFAIRLTGPELFEWFGRFEGPNQENPAFVREVVGNALP